MDTCYKSLLDLFKIDQHYFFKLFKEKGPTVLEKEISKRYLNLLKGNKIKEEIFK